MTAVAALLGFPGFTGSAGFTRSAVPADLDPSTDEARQWLADELARHDYTDTRSLFQRVMDWLLERLADLQGTQGTGGVSLPPVVITLVVVLLVAGAAFLLSRARRESRAVTRAGALLGDVTSSAEDLRREAAAALAEGRYADAVLASTRALARDAEQRTLLPDARSMTAHEVGATLRPVFPAVADAIAETMDLFDRVAYGGGPASREDALAAQATERSVRESRPVLPTAGPEEDRGESERSHLGSSRSEAPSGDADSVWMTGVRP